MKRSLLNLLLLVLIAAVLGAAAWTAYRLYETRPRAQRVEPETKPTLVEVLTVSHGAVRTTVEAMGTVVPERSVNLTAQVTGRVVELSPNLLPGGAIAKAETIVRIDPRDFELAVEREKGNVERARFELEVEKGRHTIAKREWDLLSDDVPNTPEGRALALREPHLRNARAALAAAESALKKAELDLGRTTIAAPYDVLVREKSVDVGDLVGPQTPIAALVGTEAYWVRAAVPTAKLPHIRIPGVNGEEGSPARILLETGGENAVAWEGRVIRLLGDLDPAGRMARVLIRVENPLQVGRDNAFPLLLDAYVRVEIEGDTFEDAIVLPRPALQEGDAVWIMDEDDRLAKRDVEILWRESATVLVGKGLSTGDRVIVSRVPSPLTGMQLRVAEEN